jgi:hypothetical protein
LIKLGCYGALRLTASAVSLVRCRRGRPLVQLSMGRLIMLAGHCAMSDDFDRITG